ncbi:MAG: hypothetical protein ACRD5D_07975 [Candidatus Polarisedimenticolia bacterium]
MRRAAWSLGLAVAAWHGPIAAPLELRFIGNQAFEITDGQLTLLTDVPYQSGYSGYMTYDEGSVRPRGRVLSLITHRHPDHFEPGPFLNLVEWAGTRLYFVGDTEDPGELLRAKDLDFAFVTPWLWRTVRNRKATVDARRIVIYHHTAEERTGS